MNDTGEYPSLPSPFVVHTNQTYELRELIVSNGLTVVHRARDTVLNRDVAIKTLRSGSYDAEMELRVLREGRLLARLPHPGMPPVYGFATISGGLPCLVMKMIWGQTLRSFLRGGQPSDGERSRFVIALEQVALTVAVAHSHGVIHCDLKPGNVVIGPLGEVHVTDWLLALVRTENGEENSPEPEYGAPMGTPAYMAPEQARGEWDRVDQRADVYALGGTLCTILTGVPPRSGETSLELIELARDGDVSAAFARLDVCGFDSELIALAKKCLAPRREDRPPDANAVAAALAAFRGRLT